MHLSADLQASKKDLDSFASVTKRVLDYLPNVVTAKKDFRGYTVFLSEVAGTKKYVRPIKNNLFIYESFIFRRNTKNSLEF